MGINSSGNLYVARLLCQMITADYVHLSDLTPKACLLLPPPPAILVLSLPDKATALPCPCPYALGLHRACPSSPWEIFFLWEDDGLALAFKAMLLWE